MTRLHVTHTPKWESADLPIDAEGNTKPGYICTHQLENGNGQCEANVFTIEDEVADHACIVDTRISRRTAALNLWAATLTLITGQHHYLSTSCLHGNCTYCECRTGINGNPKKPGECKSCTAHCIHCHTPREVNTVNDYHTRATIYAGRARTSALIAFGVSLVSLTLAIICLTTC